MILCLFALDEKENVDIYMCMSICIILICRIRNVYVSACLYLEAHLPGRFLFRRIAAFLY